MKRAISISLVLVMILSLFTSCKSNKSGEIREPQKSEFISTEQNENYIYDVYKDYTIIKEYIGEDFRATIPNRLGGKKVKAIGEKA
ncbi:MAG: hypothetical protein MJ120_06355, partial [Clostridia bacterium]|nr:hypothetical protein [Clostridia bacterium]